MTSFSLKLMLRLKSSNEGKLDLKVFPQFTQILSSVLCTLRDPNKLIYSS